MKEKEQPTKIVKGGFRATLALILSIIAIGFSVITFYRSTNQTEYQAEITALKEKLEKMKKETGERVNKVRQETADAVKKLGTEIRKQTGKAESSEDQ